MPGTPGWILRKDERTLVGTLLKSECLEDASSVSGKSYYLAGNGIPISVVDADQGDEALSSHSSLQKL